MCVSAIGRVISVEDGEAVVELEGIHRRALSLLVPDLEPGDLVLVGLGTVLGRVEPADRDALDHIHQAVADATAPSHRPAP
jgi:hydrogenase maturation factor